MSDERQERPMRERTKRARASEVETGEAYAQGYRDGQRARIAELEGALEETKYRSGIAHATLRHARYRMHGGEGRDNVDTALDRLAEINSLARAVLNTSREEQPDYNVPAPREEQGE